MLQLHFKSCPSGNTDFDRPEKQKKTEKSCIHNLAVALLKKDFDRPEKQKKTEKSCIHNLAVALLKKVLFDKLINSTS